MIFMPGGFAIGHSRFWTNRVGPILVLLISIAMLVARAMKRTQLAQHLVMTFPLLLFHSSLMIHRRLRPQITVDDRDDEQSRHRGCHQAADHQWNEIRQRREAKFDEERGGGRDGDEEFGGVDGTDRHARRVA